MLKGDNKKNKPLSIKTPPILLIACSVKPVFCVPEHLETSSHCTGKLLDGKEKACDSQMLVFRFCPFWVSLSDVNLGLVNPGMLMHSQASRVVNVAISG